MRLSERCDMIPKETSDLSLARRCKLLKISRSSIYSMLVGFDQATIDLKHALYEMSVFLAAVRSRAIFSNQGFQQTATACAP